MTSIRKIAATSLLIALFASGHGLLEAQTRPPVLRGLEPPKTEAPPQATASPDRQPPEVAEGDVVRVNTTLVIVPVRVMDRNGRYIPGLRREDFRVYENGVEQQIAYFAPVEQPFTVALLLDISDSTRLRLPEIKDAAIGFVDQLRPGDRVLVVAFDKQVRLVAGATSDHVAIDKAIRRLETGGGTSLCEAVEITLTQLLNRVSGRKAIVLFTDGMDTTSRGANYASNLRNAVESEVLIYTVQFDPAGFYGHGIDPFDLTYRRATAYLDELAERTGARHYVATGPRKLTEAFARVAEELRRQYSLGYYPQTSAQAGDRRAIKVTVNQPKLAVRARTSYTGSTFEKVAKPVEPKP